MQGELLVSPQVLKSTASSFGQSNRTLKSTTDSMMQKVNSLKGVFEGDAANVYIQQFNSLQEDMSRISKKISDHVKDLENMAANYEKAEQKNIQTNKSLKTNYI